MHKNVNKFFILIDLMLIKISNVIWTVYNRINMFLRGIHYENNIKFIGRTKFFKGGNSIIVVGKNCTFRSKSTSNLIGINRPCIISTLGKNCKVTIGDNSGFSGTVIGCFKEITIGNNVLCGANTLITDSDWHPDDSRSGKPKSVHIGNNVWLGEGVKVLKGVSIGENSVIGAGSIVVKDIPSNVIAAGNPCKVIKKIEIIN